MSRFFRRRRRRTAPQWKPRAEMTVLDTELRRVDGPAKVSGRAVYAHDVRLPRMLWP